MKKLDRQNRGAFSSAKAAKAWGEIAGPLVAGHTTGAHLTGGTLIVYVDNPVWATELTAMSETYRTAMNQELGQETVRAVRFTASKKVAEANKLIQQEEDLADFYHEDVVEGVPLSTAELAQIEASAAVIPDTQLREAVIRATIRDLEWKRGIAQRNARDKPRESS